MIYCEKLEYEKDILQTTLKKIQEIIKEFNEENKTNKIIHSLDIDKLSDLQYDLQAKINNLEIEILNCSNEETENDLFINMNISDISMKDCLKSLGLSQKDFIEQK